MIQIVDLSSLIPPGFQAIHEAVRLIIPDLAEQARAEIVTLANQRLTTTTEDYVQGLQPARWYQPAGAFPDGDVVVATIVLVGWLPNAIETGWAGGDMKAWLMGGRTVKLSRKGVPYRIIPFRHGTPGVTGRNFPEMGSAYAYGFRTSPERGFDRVGRMTKDSAAELGKRVYDVAKRLKPTTSHPTTGTKWGERMQAGMAPLLRPHHRTDIYAGMVRQTKTYRKATQSQYTTFRVISAAAPAGAWVHPGIEGHRLFHAVQPFVADTAGKLLRLAVAQLQGK